MYVVPGKVAVTVVTSYAAEDRVVRLSVDRARLAIEGELSVTDVETGTALQLQEDVVTLPLKRHDVRVLRIRRGSDR